MFFKYQTEPIDYFNGCQTLSEYLAGLEDTHSRNSALTELATGMAILKQCNESWWEGDISAGVYVFALPTTEVQTTVGFIWKQHNNGTTFILSPYELPWLVEDLIFDKP